MDNSKAIEFRDLFIEHLTRGNIEESVAFFEGMARDLPEVFRLECLGNIAFYQRNIKEAIKYYEAAVTLQPNHVISRFLYLAGIKSEQEEKFVEAFKYYQAAIGAEPSFVDSYIELGGLLMKICDYEGALKCYEDAVRLDSLDLSNHENLKKVLTKLNQVQIGNYEEKLKLANSECIKIIQSGKSKKISRNHNW